MSPASKIGRPKAQSLVIGKTATRAGFMFDIMQRIKSEVVKKGYMTSAQWQSVFEDDEARWVTLANMALSPATRLMPRDGVKRKSVAASRNFFMQHYAKWPDAVSYFTIRIREAIAHPIEGWLAVNPHAYSSSLKDDQLAAMFNAAPPIAGMRITGDQIANSRENLERRFRRARTYRLSRTG